MSLQLNAPSPLIPVLPFLGANKSNINSNKWQNSYNNFLIFTIDKSFQVNMTSIRISCVILE